MTSELEKSQKQLPAKYSQKLCSSFPLVVACGSQREFLRPGSQLTYIPGGRKARAKNAPDTVYRKALYISKVALDTTTVSVLEGGVVLAFCLLNHAFLHLKHQGRERQHHMMQVECGLMMKVAIIMPNLGRHSVTLPLYIFS